MKKVVFFNYYHNGDIHVSRGFIRKIIEKVHQIDPSLQFSYGHKNSPDLLADIPNLSFDHQALSVVNNDHANMITVGDTVYINTWYAQQHYRYMNRYGITMDSLYSAFDDTCKTLWGFSLEDISPHPEDFFPTINYESFQIENTKNWLNNHPGTKIFVSNGAILSDQAHYFSLTPIIDTISKKHPDKIFILSNQDGHPGSCNVFHSSDIILKPGNDLNENSYLASHCDMIIGKSSGSFTFAMTQENYFKRDVKILAFCNLTPVYPNRDFWIGSLLRDKIQYRAKVIVNNDPDANNIASIIDGHL